MAQVIQEIPVHGEVQVMTKAGLLTFVDGVAEVEDDKADLLKGISGIRVRLPKKVDEAAEKAAAEAEAAKKAEEEAKAAAEAEAAKKAEEEAKAAAEAEEKAKTSTTKKPIPPKSK